MSDADIAAKHGLGKKEVEGLRKGEGRPYVAQWIRRWKDECQRNPSLHLALLKRHAVETMAKAMAGEGSSTALAAAKEFLNHTLGSRWIGPDDGEPRPASSGPRPALDLTDLPRGLKIQVLRALGGPLDLGDGPLDDEGSYDGRDLDAEGDCDGQDDQP
jgi:hypothetical protein